eukprot:7259111-Pyramimonas_sp.AAC.1
MFCALFRGSASLGRYASLHLLRAPASELAGTSKLARGAGKGWPNSGPGPGHLRRRPVVWH